MKFINALKSNFQNIVAVTIALTFSISLVIAPVHAAEPYRTPLWCTGFTLGDVLQGYIASSGISVVQNPRAGIKLDNAASDPFQQQQTQPIRVDSSNPTILQYYPNRTSGSQNGQQFRLTRETIQLLNILESWEVALSYTELATARTRSSVKASDFPNGVIPPGHYNKIEIDRNATFTGGLGASNFYYVDDLDVTVNNVKVTFNEGNYYFGKFNARNSFEGYAVGRVRVHIGREFFGGNGALFNMNRATSSLPLPSPDNLRMYLYNEPGEPRTTVTFDQNFEIRGLIYSEAVNTFITLGNNSKVVGGIAIMGQLELTNNSVAVIQDALIGPNPGGGSRCLDHIKITYPTTQQLSCLALPVTVTPCGDADCRADNLYLTAFDLRLSSIDQGSSSSFWRGYNTDPIIEEIAGVTNFSVSNIQSGTVTLASEYWSTSLTPSNWQEIVFPRQQCSTADCQINFIESGLVFSGSNTDPSIPISPKRAGSLFDSYLWALRTDVDVEEGTATCAPLFTEQPVRTVNFRLACTDPGTCSGTPYVIQSAAHPAINVHSAGYTAGQVTFNTSGYAPLTNRFNDVGQIRVDAFLQLESPAGAITEPDDRLAIRTSVTGAANLLVYPAGLAIVLSESVSSPNPFKAAGENFNLSVVGLYDPLPTEQPTPLPITPNFGSESSISWAGSSLASGPLTVGVELVAPNDGVLGTFGGEWLSNTNGAINYTNVYYHEAGVIRAIPQLAGHSYLGHNIGVSGYTQYPLELGTFYPASLSIVDGNFSNAHSCGVFTYMDHDALDLSFQIEALAALRPGETTPSRTVNYTAGFPDLASIGIAAAETLSGSAVPDNLIARFEIFDEPSDTWLAIDAVRSDWVDGVLQFSMPADEYLRFARLATFAPDGPYRDVRVGLYVESETYGETIDAAGAEFEVDVGGTTVSAVRIGTVDDIQDIFYGRLTLENIFGPEDEDLPVIMRAEYYNGSRFVLNTLDSCTPFDYNNLTLVPDAPLPEKGGEVSGELIDGWLPHNNMRWIALGEAGTVEFEYEAPEWLKFLWEDGATSPTNPRAIGEFGRYRSYDRILFRRQQ